MLVRQISGCSDDACVGRPTSRGQADRDVINHGRLSGGSKWRFNYSADNRTGYAGLATQYTIEGDLGLAALGELGQGFDAERKMIGLNVKVDGVLIPEPLVKREMPRTITVFVEAEGADVASASD